MKIALWRKNPNRAMSSPRNQITQNQKPEIHVLDVWRVIESRELKLLALLSLVLPLPVVVH